MIKVEETFEIDYLDASGTCEVSRCPAKYLFSRLMGLSLPDKYTIPLDFGTDMHIAIPFCYKGVGKIDEALEAFNKAWDVRGYEDDPKRNPDRACAMLENFAETHSPDICAYKIVNFDIPIPTEEEIGSNEIPFLIDIGGDLLYAGRLDASVIWRSTGDLWALDYKTSGEVSGRYFNNFHNSPQAVGCSLALQHLSGKPVQGMIIEALRVSKTNAENQLVQIFVQKHQMESYVNFVNRQSSLVKTYNKLKAWPKHSTGCAPYSMFGTAGYMCEYRDICDCPNWQDGARFYKKEEPWHPFVMKVGKDSAKT